MVRVVIQGFWWEAIATLRSKLVKRPSKVIQGFWWEAIATLRQVADCPRIFGDPRLLVGGDRNATKIATDELAEKCDPRLLVGGDRNEGQVGFPPRRKR